MRDGIHIESGQLAWRCRDWMKQVVLQIFCLKVVCNNIKRKYPVSTLRIIGTSYGGV